MRIARVKDPTTFPRTRRELLSHLWGTEGLEDCDLWREGPLYALRVGRKICATGIRSIANHSFDTWEQIVGYHICRS